MIKGEGNRKRKCKECEVKIPACDGLIVGVNFVCSRECAFNLANKALSKSRERQKQKDKREHKEKRKEATARHRERKEEVRPIKWYADRAQREFNKYIRLRDKGIPCISCGKPDDGSHQRHASHYRSRGACSYLRFDESNVHASCSVCNNHMSGNISGYMPALIRKIGIKEFERIESSPKLKKWNKKELIDIYLEYKKRCKLEHL